jgi:hypothetical protein
MAQIIVETPSSALIWYQTELYKHEITITYPTSAHGPTKTTIDIIVSTLIEHHFSADLPAFKEFLIEHTVLHVYTNNFSPIFGIHMNSSNCIRVTDTFIEHCYEMFRKPYHPQFLCEILQAEL